MIQLSENILGTGRCKEVELASVMSAFCGHFSFLLSRLSSSKILHGTIELSSNFKVLLVYVTWTKYVSLGLSFFICEIECGSNVKPSLKRQFQHLTCVSRYLTHFLFFFYFLLHTFPDIWIGLLIQLELLAIIYFPDWDSGQYLFEKRVV